MRLPSKEWRPSMDSRLAVDSDGFEVIVVIEDVDGGSDTTQMIGLDTEEAEAMAAVLLKHVLRITPCHVCGRLIGDASTYRRTVHGYGHVACSAGSSAPPASIVADPPTDPEASSASTKGGSERG